MAEAEKSGFISKVIGDKRRWRQYKARTRELPPDYRTAIERCLGSIVGALAKLVTYLGGGAAFIQAYLKIIPPPAYGICFVCHPKDLFNWVSDHIFGTNFGNVTVSVDWPVLTVVGVVLGAFIAAKQHGEFHLEDAREPPLAAATGTRSRDKCGSHRPVFLAPGGHCLGLAGETARVATGPLEDRRS